MTIGIHMRYQRCETTWIGLQVASWLRTEGHSCSVLSLGEKGASVHTDWDGGIKTDYKHQFKDWVKKQSRVLWFNDVAKADVNYAKQHKIKTILLASWDDNHSRSSLYDKVDKVVCFSPSLANRLRKTMGLNNIVYAPLDIPTLDQLNTVLIRPDKPRILLNIRGPRKQQLGSQLSGMLSRWFKHFPAEWTVWTNKSQLHHKSWVQKCGFNLHKQSSINFESKIDWDTQRLLYGWSDLTLWPTINTGHALPVLMSLTMGTPIATFDVPPANEYVNKDNSILAPCQIRYNPGGTASVVPDLVRYEGLVSRLITQNGMLKHMKQHAGDWAEERRSLFKQAWRDIIS